MDLYTPSSVTYGGAYSIRPYNRVRAILRNTDAIPQPDTCCPFEKLSRFRRLRGRLWGVFDTPLRLGTYNPPKYRCNFPTGYVRSFKKWICFRPLRGRLWGVFDTPLRPGTCDPMKYRYNSPTGYVLPFKKWICFHPLRGRLWGVFNTPL